MERNEKRYRKNMKCIPKQPNKSVKNDVQANDTAKSAPTLTIINRSPRNFKKVNCISLYH